jgi:hypothetical protein
MFAVHNQTGDFACISCSGSESPRLAGAFSPAAEGETALQNGPGEIE